MVGIVFLSPVRNSLAYVTSSAAQVVNVFEGEATAEPTTEPTATSTASPDTASTATPAPTGTEAPTATPEETETGQTPTPSADFPSFTLVPNVTPDITEEPVPTETPGFVLTPVPGGEDGGADSDESGTDGPKTGDDTPIGIYLGVVMACFGALVILLIRKGKNRNN
ncbi:MAG: LPXTG cell wall anchor domain-containing protein [Oscillospiraceae bacterium]|nr:LPXTG cell wall anchor domain-containing protein [Oscillospiraceae bacterium]